VCRTSVPGEEGIPEWGATVQSNRGAAERSRLFNRRRFFIFHFCPHSAVFARLTHEKMNNEP
jgi:hypothetical protein